MPSLARSETLKKESGTSTKDKILEILGLVITGTVNLNKICHFWIHYVEVRNIASPSNCDHFR